MSKMNLNRTVEEFVEDMVSDGKDLNYILTVAVNTRWKNFREEVEQIYFRLVK